MNTSVSWMHAVVERYIGWRIRHGAPRSLEGVRPILVDAMMRLEEKRFLLRNEDAVPTPGRNDLPVDPGGSGLGTFHPDPPPDQF